MSAPEGWDYIPPEMMEGAKMMRQLYISLLAAGFSTFEAATVMGAMMAANTNISPTKPKEE
jgi:hypothetical protein